MLEMKKSRSWFQRACAVAALGLAGFIGCSSGVPSGEQEPIGSVTPEELATFIQGRSGMTQGWTGSFDKLEEYLARV